MLRTGQGVDRGSGDGRTAEASKKRPTINDIARMAGVSKKTVSRVINDSPLVRGETREAVKAVILETGFAPDPQDLVVRFKNVVGFVTNMTDVEAARGRSHLRQLHDFLRGGEMSLFVFESG